MARVEKNEFCTYYFPVSRRLLHLPFWSDIMDMKFTYRGVNDTRLKMEELDTYPAVVLGGNNPKLMAQINNYAPMR